MSEKHTQNTHAMSASVKGGGEVLERTGETHLLVKFVHTVVIWKPERKRNEQKPAGFVWRCRDVVCRSGPKPVSSSI